RGAMRPALVALSSQRHREPPPDGPAHRHGARRALRQRGSRSSAVASQAVAAPGDAAQASCWHGAPDYAVDRGPPCSVRPPRDAAPRRESALGAMAAMAPARVAAAPPAATPTVLADAPP